LTSINQQELIRPLLKIVTPTIAKMLNDKFLKTMSKHLPNLAEEVEKVFTATVLMIQARYSGNYSKDFLLDIEDFLVAAFGYGKKSVKTKTNEMWQVTFGLLPKSEVPPALGSALKKCSNPSLRAQWTQEEIVSFPSSTDSQSGSGSQPFIITAEPAIANAINRKMTPKKSPPPPDAPSEMKPPANKPQIKKKGVLEDDSSQDFVAIKSSVPKKRVLTDHQKDVMTSRHDDIPALYSELSRDDSIIHLPSQFMSQHSIDESQPSTDLWDKIKGGNKKKKETDVIDESGKPKEITLESGEDTNGPVEEGSQSLLEIEKKAAMKELKNKRFELRLEDTPKADKIAKEETKKLRAKRKAEDHSESSEKRTKLDFTENTKEMNGQSKSKEEIADDLFKSSQSDEMEAAKTNDPDSVEIVSPEPKPSPETVLLTSSDENTIKPAESVNIDVQELSTENVNVQELEKDLSRVNVKVQKLSPVAIKKHTEHEKGISAPIKKKLFGEPEPPAEVKDDSSEDDIIQSSQPQKEELEQSRSKRGRRSLSKLEMEVKQMPQKKLTRGKKELKSDSKEVEKRNAFGETALHAAAKKGDAVKVEEQLKAGADPNVKDNAGWYPLHEVSISDKENSLAIMNLLIKHGAIVDCQNKEGVTPLQEAVENALDKGVFEKKVEVLLSAGADPDLKTENGKTAFDFAEGDQILINILKREKSDMNLTPTRTSSREKKRSVRLANFVDMDCDNEEASIQKVMSETEKSAEKEDGENTSKNDSSKVSLIDETLEVDENPNVLVNQNGTDDEDSKKDNSSSENSDEATNVSKERSEGSASPDANKENVSTNGDDDHTISGKIPLGSQNGLANISGEEKREKVNPFTAVIDKHKAESKKRPSLGSAGTSRGAMLLSLSRRSSLDPGTTRPSAAALALLDPIQGSPVSAFSSPKPDISKSMPWVKYKPSPSSASPSASILKRKGLDSESSNCEDSPISTKNPRLDTSLNGRRVHFNEDPVSDSVEIPRVPDGKHTRKKLQLSGFDQEMFVDKAENDTDAESQGSLGLYSDSPPPDLTMNAIYPELKDSKEPIALIVPHLATGNWAKILATDLKNNGITQVGQLAIMDPSQIRILRGVKPNKVDSVKNTLKTLHKKLLKEGKMVDEKKEKAKAPVEEVTTPEDEEKIKEDLFHRPSPSPTDLGFSPLDAIPTSPDRNDVEMDDFEIKKEIDEKPSDLSPSKTSPTKDSPMLCSPTKASGLYSPTTSPYLPSPSKASLMTSPLTSPSKSSPIPSPLPSPAKESPITSPHPSPSKAFTTTSPIPSPSKASPMKSPSRESTSPIPSPSKASTMKSPSRESTSPASPELKSMSVRIPRMKTIQDVSQDLTPELEDVSQAPEKTDQTVGVSEGETGLEDLKLTDEQLKKLSNAELMKLIKKVKEFELKVLNQLESNINEK